MGSLGVRSLLAVLLALIAPTSLIQAQASSTTPIQAQAALEALAAPLYRELAALKGMATPGPPPPVLIRTREETRRFIQQELDRRYSPARVEGERKAMVAWGLIPPDYDLRRLFVDLMEEQIAAYYDPRGKVMVVGDWLSPEQQQSALMHELVHALQDREISLDGFLAPDPGHGDQLLARQALIEGEAVALTLELALKAEGADLASLPDLGPLRSALGAGAAGPAIGTAPRFLRDLLLFPYVDGLAFVHRWRKREPWSAMSALYRDPPRSTAQILSPAKRLTAREDPVGVALPDLDTLMTGARVVAEDEMGEFTLGSMLGLYLGEEAGRAAAAGWRGDRYRIWEDVAGRFTIAYVLVMDSERTANAFADLYAKVLERRHPALARRGAPGPAIWRDGDRVFAVEGRGADVLILERAPVATADRMREAIWRVQPGGGAFKP
jgi:hypothetical protein